MDQTTPAAPAATPSGASPLLVLCHPRCTTCRRALAWLEAHGVAHEVRDITTDNPTAAELARWHRASGLPVRRLFNTSGRLYRELGVRARLDAGMTDEECYELLATDGMLVRRPIAVRADGAVLVGFREAEWEALLG